MKGNNKGQTKAKMLLPFLIIVISACARADGPPLCSNGDNSSPNWEMKLSSDTKDDPKVHIVYLGRNPHKDDPHLASRTHHETLSAALGSSHAAKSSMLYSYKHGFSGFAAKMNAAQAKAISHMPGVVSVFPSKSHKLHTTYSWRFMGLDPNSTRGNALLRKTGAGSDVIIGVLDTGIWPESASFSDNGMPPVPKRWKGTCKAGQSFNTSQCNRKLIGARWYNKGWRQLNLNVTEYESARDRNGHGTHVASTAAGNEVDLGEFGVARGTAPFARIAAYKVAWGAGDQVMDEDILAGLDEAIHDKVDLISISIGSGFGPYLTSREAIALGAFHAMEKGILVVAGAGNEGPTLGTVKNLAPWVLTVAAGTLDRAFQADLLLGDNVTEYKSTSVDKDMKKGWYPVHVSESGACTNGSLDANLVKGNYVLCSLDPLAEVAAEVKRTGGAGIIVPVARKFPDPVTGLGVPVLIVSPEFGVQLENYISFSQSPRIHVSPSVQRFGYDPAPVLASFSSRGPNSVTPDILKPDVTAPGVQIIAAVRNGYNFMSGTSMACPHVSGIAALIKSLHPEWSPSAIKSAIVTTASTLDTSRGVIVDEATLQASNPFGFGAGHVRPLKAADPGLVYETSPDDYALFSCLQHTSQEISEAANATFKCPVNPPSASNLNYPSITISNLNSRQTVTRVVTNVGASPNATYHVEVEVPHGVEVHVFPDTLEFSDTVKKLSYNITCTPVVQMSQRYVFGSLTWSDGFHDVKSPIVLQVNHDVSFSI